MARDFYSKYFRDNSIIPIKCLMAAFDIEARNEGISLNADIVNYMTFLIDPKNTGQVALDALSLFFDRHWSTPPSRQKVFQDAQNFSAIRLYGEPYNKNLILEFIKVGKTKAVGDRI